MMRFPQDTIEKVREACDIAEIVGEHVALKKSGQNLKGLCPFHSERTPSFVVSPAKQVFHCFGCGAGGNVISFVMQIENLSFVEAVRSLATRKGVELPRERTETDSVRMNLLSALEFAVSFYRKALMGVEGKKAREYLDSRGIGQKTREEFSLGYAPQGWDALLNATKKHFPESVLLQSGLVVPREGKSGTYDRFRDRLMFPVLSPGGKALGFGARAFDDAQPKYLNSSDSMVFQKGSVLYGLYQSKRAMRAKEQAIVVEGYTDLLALFQHGFENVAASCGTAFTAEQARLLKRYSPEAVLIYDGDDAGIQAARRALQIFAGSGLGVRVVCLPSGHDPDSFLREKGADAMREVIESSWSITQFLLQTSPGGMSKENRVRSLMDVFALVEDPIYRRLQIQEAAEALRFDENTIAFEVGRMRSKGGALRRGPQFETGSVNRVERELIKLILQHSDVRRAARDSIGSEHFSSPQCREAFGLLKGLPDSRDINAAELLDATESASVKALLSSVMLEEPYDFEEPLAVFDDYIRKLRHRWLTESIRTLEEEIRKQELAKESGKVRELLARLQTLAAERSSLNDAR